ncbi:hypothetical protein GCM10010510_17420 [Streptomyces anandii JCM 4720]|nr:hypothetical protein GCM10010510_17420 [Streptomyces anandii JCM 4720]
MLSSVWLLLFAAGAATATWAEDQGIGWLASGGTAVGSSVLGAALVMAGPALLWGGSRGRCSGCLLPRAAIAARSHPAEQAAAITRRFVPVG